MWPFGMNSLRTTRKPCSPCSISPHTPFSSCFLPFFFSFCKKNKSINNTTGEAPPCARDLRKGRSSRCVQMSEMFVGAFSCSKDPWHSLDQRTAFHWLTVHQPRGLVQRGGASRGTSLWEPTLAQCLLVTMVAPVHRARGLSDWPSLPGWKCPVGRPPGQAVPTPLHPMSSHPL